MSNAVVPAIPLDPAVPDPYLWLEEVEGDDALGWVEERNAETMRTLGSTDLFAANRDAIREVLDSDDRIPEVTRRGDFLYNFWRDADHERGLWRRTTLDSYRTAAPQWEVLLDLDALAAADDTAWVWHGAEVLRPADPAQPWRRALIALSVGGSDADVTREFDLETRQFIAPTAGGFHREEAKGGLTWVDADTVYCHTDFGDGSLTTSGYPRTVRLWRRGTPLAEAPVVYEGEHDDMVIYAGRSSTPGFERDFVSRVMTFYTSQTYLVRDVGTPEQELIHLEVPDSAMIGAHREWLLVTLRDDWTIEERTHLAGSLLVIDFDAFLGGSRDFTTLFTPTPSTSLAGAAWTLSHLVLNVLDDVKNRVTVLTPPPLEESPEGAPRGPEGGGDCPWLAADLPISDPISTLVVRAVDPRVSDDVWVTSTSFLRPSTLSLGRIGSDGTVALEPLKAAPAFFAGDGLQAEQRFATSDDGTRIPYFIVGRPEQLHPAGADHWPAPTMLWGYGGFEIAVTPSYNPTVGRARPGRGLFLRGAGI
ncbi:MAG: S9 family peptidase [Promicromonosporaceae bacterium]|nr:S9 family peptidase [Promicromonosporaceae bacterium]